MNTVIPESRIVGGTAARPGQLLFVASLRTTQHGHFCGGTIIGNRWVLTSASCVYNHNAGSFTVRTGTQTINRLGIVHRTSAVVSHEHFDYYNRFNDIALIKTVTTITPNAQTAFATISPSAPGINPNSLATVAGWGFTHTNGQRSETLQYFQTPIITNDRCRSLLTYNNYAHLVQPTNVCALSHAGQGVCTGDSGSPLAIGNQLVGIVSFGVKCATGVPDVFTRVASFYYWIEANKARLQ